MYEEYQSRSIAVKPGKPIARRLIHTHEETFTRHSVREDGDAAPL